MLYAQLPGAVTTADTNLQPFLAYSAMLMPIAAYHAKVISYGTMPQLP
jgi:hypothetical protein